MANPRQQAQKLIMALAKKAEAKKPEAAEPKATAKPAEPKAEKKAEAAPKPPATVKPEPKPKAEPKADTFSLHLNKTGRLCIGKEAAERLGDAPFVALKIEGKIVRLLPEKKESDSTIAVKYADPEYTLRPYVSASKAWKSLGWTGAEGIDIEAKPYGNGGFEFRLQ